MDKVSLTVVGRKELIVKNSVQKKIFSTVMRDKVRISQIITTTETWQNLNWTSIPTVNNANTS